MSAKAAAPDLGTASAGQIAAILGISRQAVEDHIAGGRMPTPIAKGQHSVLACVQAYIAICKGEAKAGTKAAAQNIAQVARAREIEQRIAERDRELITMSDAVSTLDDIIGAVLTEFNALPASVTRDRALRRMIEQKVDAAQKRIVDTLDKAMLALRAGEADASAEAEDAAG
jgi:hypothetical protein